VNKITNQPLFLWLLPLFYVLHGATENFDFVGVKDALILFGVYFGFSLLFCLLFCFLYKGFNKAALASFAIMAFNLFFGSLHDFLKNTFPNTFITRYSFILPITAILLLIFIIYLKKTKKNPYRLAKYLNFLFLLLILIDMGTLILKSSKTKKKNVVQLTKEFIPCDTCYRPDIYLIIADEYAGKSELQDIFTFNNSEFENDLIKRGFHVVNDSKANYNSTVHSMASILNMDYIKYLNPNRINQNDILTCQYLIKQNNLLYFLQKNGYEIYNFSFFDLDSKQRAVNNLYFPSIRELLNSQTFIYRFKKDLGFHFATRQKLEDIKKHDLYNNNKIDSLTRIIASKKSAEPKFVYTHLSMPHHPYYFDSSGKEAAYEILTDEYASDKKAYVEYLLYTNKKLLELVDYIKLSSTKPPIIILMGDHGFRQFADSANKQYYFMNLNTVYFPNGNYSLFYNGMSNVNEFRVILNSQFGQKLSLLMDSTSFLVE
jgi:Sulfatase